MIYSEPLISKKEFVSIINTIRDRNDLVAKIDDICLEYRTLLKDDLPYSGSMILGGEEEILKLLESLMKDTCGDISWFMWEVDFGRRFVMGYYTDNGKDIDLSSAEKLYDYLVKVNFQNEKL